MSILYTCIGKGGLYEFVTFTVGAGTSKGQSFVIYRDINTGLCYHRTAEDFHQRMEEVKKNDPV